MIRRLLLAAVLSVVPGTVIVSAAPAHAFQDCGVIDSCIYQFYSDASHSQVVGWIHVTCQDVTTTWGTTTNYLTYHSSACNK